MVDHLHIAMYNILKKGEAIMSQVFYYPHITVKETEFGKIKRLTVGKPRSQPATEDGKFFF